MFGMSLYGYKPVFTLVYALLIKINHNLGWERVI